MVERTDLNRFFKALKGLSHLHQLEMRRKSKAKSGIFSIPTEIPLSTTNARLGQAT